MSDDYLKYDGRKPEPPYPTDSEAMTPTPSPSPTEAEKIALTAETKDAYEVAMAILTLIIPKFEQPIFTVSSDILAAMIAEYVDGYALAKVQQEREECARIAESINPPLDYGSKDRYETFHSFRDAQKQIATAIRSREPLGK